VKPALIGHVDTVSHGRIAGWAADPAQPARAVDVIVRLGGRQIRVAAQTMRPDLAAIFPGATGRYGFMLEDGPLPLSPFVATPVEVVFAGSLAPVDGGRVLLAPVGSGGPAPGADGRAPIVVTTTGRSGSSLLMARLAGHPAIVVARGHPYEAKQLSYYAQALRVLTAEADRARSTHPDTMGRVENRFFIGSNPFSDGAEAAAFWTARAPDRLRACFAGLLQDYYDCVAGELGRGGAPYFAEKIGTSDLVREAAGFLFGTVREIVLVRDPRDIACSAKSFWGRDFEASLKDLRGQFLRMVRPRTEPGLKQIVLRYEDLLLSPADTLSRLWDFLELPADAWRGDGAAEAAVFGVHGTGGSPSATVGRWRRDLSAVQAEAAGREFHAVLEEFGYREEGVLF
jgi:hypothetical protein